ncbi:afadin-like isoform X3 [Amphibalanus amphitrite]|uniref:afadin-like isoform X3 n=1 Tax=Amphibalanus amphitrite TaxID=1232801 RepID=UPI001C908992|nr:afadin-like isoform X3 [Amphibalanus amphitrite]
MEPATARQRDHLSNVIAQWNANRLDLFELSEPNDQLEFHGVMRFYYQDSGQKVCTKCIRVSSTATARDVIAALAEKFRPDMRMLSTPRFAVYEIHESGEERQLDMDERPLHVQLNWNQDDREGRFLLRNLDEKPWSLNPTREPTGGGGDSNFKRKLSRREKKQMKKQDKLRRMQSSNENDPGVAEKLYTELPETSFTRSISNPEAVMRRRRQQKLEKKLQQFRSRDGGPDTGGTLKIYGESLCSEVPYKTLLLSVTDTAAVVVAEMLQKYGRHSEDPNNYALVQVVTQDPQPESAEYRQPTGPFNEFVLDDDDCPLAILMNQPPMRGSIMFHVRRRSADYQPRKRKKKPSTPASLSEVDHSYRGHDEASLPFLVELNADGTDIRYTAPRRFSLHLNVTEVGSERSSQAGGQCLQLAGHNVHPRHCVIAHTEGIVTVTPCGREAETYVNGQRVYETTILQHGSVVQFGRVYKFRFLDPNQEERLRGGRRDSLRGHESYMERSTTYASYGRGSDAILPAVLEFREETEDAFLRAVISQLDPSSLQFKLAPTYTLYMSARFRASTHYRSELTPDERATKLTEVLAKVSAMVQDVIQTRRHDANSLAFWMANASEYLHFLKQDRHISPYSVLAQDILAESVQTAFRYLVECVQGELVNSISLFLEDRDDANEEEGTTAEILSILGNTMALLRRCRVNAALTIQLFSQLFHYINMSVFNRVVTNGPVNYCSRLWGVRLKRRLSRIELWADRQGLELAADCHLGRVVQAAHLLTAPKATVDELSVVSSSCYRLNSLQLRAILSRYRPARDEPAISPDLVENIVRMAEGTSDELARQDGRQVRLEEDRDLQLPFLLPEDGYSCDIVRGIPNGLAEFLAPLQHAGLARMSEQPTSWGYWTIYMTDQDLTKLQQQQQTSRSQSSLSVRSLASVPPFGNEQPVIQQLRLHKTNTGMGLSIVAAKGAGMDRPGIYIKSVVRGGAADLDGRLSAGDQLCEVDGHSLIGVSQEQAAEYMTRTGPVVNLLVAKQAAAYHGLTTLLSQPSPVMTRGGPRDSSRDPAAIHQARIQASKSVPSLNSAAGGGSELSPVRSGPGPARPAAPAGLSAAGAALVTPPRPSRARSEQNLHQYRYQPVGTAAGTAGGTAPYRHPPTETPPGQQSLRYPPSPARHQHHGSLHQLPETPPRHQHHGSLHQHHGSLHQLPETPPRHQHQSSLHQPEPASPLVHYQYQPPGAPPQMAMARSVSEHDHLRYLPMDNTSSNNLLLRHSTVGGTPERHWQPQISSPGPTPAPADRVNGRLNGLSSSDGGSSTGGGTGSGPGSGSALDARQQEIRRMQQELEEAQAAERRILQEAQRRQAQEQAGQRLDAVLATPPPPPPPVRSVSYSIMAAAVGGGSPAGQQNGQPAAARRVQFTEPESPPSPQPEEETETEQRPEQPPVTLNVVSTPGVIGAQEVYRDPRTRRLAQLENSHQRPAGSPLPERLSFKEKMKMFAVESGEPGTPNQRSTSSSRQREIELKAGGRAAP